MVSELAIPLSANVWIDPAMDPFDRSILLCEKILSKLSGRKKQPEDSGVDHELADDCDNSTSSPDGAMPANCSTLGFTPNVGGVEAVDSSQQLGIVSMVSLGPVEAPPPSTMQQFGILKPDKHTPTTCLTVVLDMGCDAMRAKLHGLVDLTESHVDRLVTTPWDPGEQLIMPWSYSCVCCQVNILEWIWQQQIMEAIMVSSVPSALLLFDGSAVLSHVHNHHFLLENWIQDPSATWYVCLNIGAAHGRIVAWKVDGEHLTPLKMPWLFSCHCSQVNISKWTGHQPINEDIIDAFVPSSMHCCDSVDVSSVYKHILILVPSGGIRCAEVCLFVHHAPPTKSMLPDLRAAWATCESLLVRPFCGDRSEDLVMLIYHCTLGPRCLPPAK